MTWTLFFLIIIPLPHLHLFSLVMAEVDHAEVTIDGDFVAHFERMPVKLTELIVNVNFKAIATDHADFAKADCRNCSM